MTDPARYARIPLAHRRLGEDEMRERSRDFRERMNQRRTVRDFSPEPVPMEVLADAIATAGTAPSGANQQPWTFVVVTDADLKRKIREAAEEEERISYGGRMSDEWLRALAPLGTDWQKPHITVAPALIVVFAQATGLKRAADGSGIVEKVKHYYVQESVGIAVGLLLAALHNAGLCTLTHTPSPMKFLAELLGRPENERAFVLIPVGYPTADATVPDVKRKSLDEIAVWM
ncbi:MAG: nitroreductase family protein [Planctomycetota bacterium]